MENLSNKGVYPYNILTFIGINEENMNNDMISKFEEIVKSVSNERHFKLTMMYFRDKMTCTQIAKGENLTVSVVPPIIRKVIRRLKSEAIRKEIITTVFNKEYEITPDTDITILNMPAIVTNALKRAGIDTIGELHNVISQNHKWYDKVRLIGFDTAMILEDKLNEIYKFEEA